MRGTRWGLAVGGVALALVASARLSLRAQDRLQVDEADAPAKAVAPGRAASPKAREVLPSVRDALEQPFTMPFGEPTTLDQVCKHLRRTLNAPVVLDIAALDRQEVKPDDTVELELNGVRLKTGLKLLLDQVGLTYRIVPEDNLLILTDSEGADDPLNRVLAEVKELHRDIHDVQDALDEVRAALGLDEAGPRMRKPTIIEEIPVEPEEGKVAPPLPGRPRPGM